MKYLLFFLLLAPLACFCQSNEFGRVEKDTLILNTGEKFWPGKEIRLGYATNQIIGFEYITLSPWSLAGPQHLGAGYSNMKMTVKKFELAGMKRTGKKFYVVAKGGNLSPYWIDIVSALNQKEVVSDAVQMMAEQPKGKPDIAEQIKKLKELKDSGALSQEQYDAAVKKVLEN